MIDITTKSGETASILVLEGSMSGTREADDVADRVLGRFPADRPLVVDLSALRVDDADDLAWLILRLEAAPGWSRFRLVDEHLAARRRLREMCRRLPILPDIATAMQVLDARSALAPAAGPVVATAVDLRETVTRAAEPEVAEGLSTGG